MGESEGPVGVPHPPGGAHTRQLRRPGQPEQGGHRAALPLLQPRHCHRGGLVYVINIVFNIRVHILQLTADMI